MAKKTAKKTTKKQVKKSSKVKVENTQNVKISQKDLSKLISKATKVPKRIHNEVRDNTIKAILAAFGFIIALVWRDAIRAGIDKLIISTGINGSGYIYDILAATLVTIFCVIGIVIFSRFEKKEDE